MNETQEKTVLSLLERQQYASVEELSAALAVSASTTRRILEGLQNRKLITRTHGGAKLNDANNAAPSFTFRIHQNLFEKKKIALSAIKLIKDGDIIFLDGSTTAYCIAEYLGEFRNIKVITNGIETLSLLSQNRIPAYSTGGEVSAENPAVLAGGYAEDGEFLLLGRVEGGVLTTIKSFFEVNTLGTEFTIVSRTKSFCDAP